MHGSAMVRAVLPHVASRRPTRLTWASARALASTRQIG